MAELEPLFVANLASDIYDVKNPITRKAFYAAYKNSFELGEDSSMEAKGIVGKTGGILLKTAHMMAVAAEGKKDTPYEGQAIVAIKGTASLMDALTDLNAGLKNSNSGGKVHQGFQDAFTSFSGALPTFSAGVHTIHCVGHSLGGALATLAADWLKSTSGREIKLYTFGSPRVGLDFFANSAERRIGPSNVFRVYHQTDPVPMVPTWPFMHIPDGGKGDLLLPSGLHLKPWEFHSMVRYIASTKGDGKTGLAWQTLRAKRPKDVLDGAVEQWLKSDGIASLTLNTARVVSAAVLWVVKKLINLAGVAVVMAGSTTFTLLDRLAMLMHKALDFAKDVSFWVLRLIKRMAQLVGVVLVEGANVTLALIRTVFMRFHHAVSELVRQAGRTLKH
ncbi:lipase family protein [Simiduia sp. 21SJ11W-1]|uniref:lipase family protein n=1 Tax=Simiduia sp. 21SJ11W-1 TaxID=2909669 RepID=UPI0020A1313E|nr:lipase family protein [Simiduia sp. 21SJ11W-1]UTA46979.1 lipase family protein [Simiduia sp. 21SJ11W-1]